MLKPITNVMTIPLGFSAGIIAGLILKAAVLVSITFAAVLAAGAAVFFGAVFIFNRADDAGWRFIARKTGNDEKVLESTKAAPVYFWLPALVGTCIGALITNDQLNWVLEVFGR